MGFKKPSKIQQRAIQSLVGQSQSGTGKTAAFMINIIAIVLAPSRELAIQLFNVFLKMSRNLNIKTALLIKDHIQCSDNNNIVYNVNESHVIIGTPGRVYDYIKKKFVLLDNVKICVLDEADQMLNMQSLGTQTIKIKKLLKNTVQMILFSATFPDRLKQFALIFAPDSNQISLKEEELSVKAIKQYYIDCRNRRMDADTISQKMIEEGHKVIHLHGGLSPTERDDKMRSFRQGDCKILITTNVLSRGIDIPRINIVINYDMPMDENNNQPDYETYLHRIGRTGRFGKIGASIDFIHSNQSWEIMELSRRKYQLDIVRLDPENFQEMEALLKEANKQLI